MQDARQDARQDAGPDGQHETQSYPTSGPSYIGDTNADLLALEWDGFEQGYVSFISGDTAPATEDRIVEAAGEACARTLTCYVFLNREAFHQAFTHGWIAGYLAGRHGWRRP